MDKKTLKHIAKLSRISLTDKELDTFTPQMKTILDSAKELQKIDTTNVQASKRHVAFSSLRNDICVESLSQKEALTNAKYTENGFVKVYGKVFGNNEES